MVQLELQPQPCQRDARCHCHRTPTCRWLGTRDECPCECCSAERGRLRALHVRRGGGYISGRGETGIRFAAPRSGSGRGAPPLAGDQCVRSDPCTRINGRARSDRIGSVPRRRGRHCHSPASGVGTAARDLLQPNHGHRLRRPSSCRACFALACRVPCSRGILRGTPTHTWRSSKQDGRDREKIALSTGFKKISVRKM